MKLIVGLLLLSGFAQATSQSVTGQGLAFVACGDIETGDEETIAVARAREDAVKQCQSAVLQVREPRVKVIADARRLWTCGVSFEYRATVEFECVTVHAEEVRVRHCIDLPALPVLDQRLEELCLKSTGHPGFTHVKEPVFERRSGFGWGDANCSAYVTSLYTVEYRCLGHN